MAPLLFRPPSLFFVATTATLMIVAGALGAAGQDFPKPNDFGKCLAITEDAARLRCYKSAPTELQQHGAQHAGTWRLVRTPNVRGGADVVSITHTADTSRSDLDLAGLMIRCGENGLQALVVAIEPRPPRTQLRVQISADGHSSAFTASVVRPFSMILLPSEALTLITGTLKSRAELTIQIESDGSSVRGVVPLAGLPAALQSLKSSCASL